MSTNILLVVSLVVMAAALAITLVPATPPSDPNWGETVRYHRSGPEKITKLHFYFHDIVTGDNPTAIPIASAPITNSSLTAFGLLYMMDDPLTETADPNSKLLGRAQGLFGASSAHNEISLIMGISIVFTAEDRFKGSTITVFTRNPYQHGKHGREFSIVGGTGYFRFASGFISAKTVWEKGLDVIVQYNCTVVHY
ncbi:hypothetical protein MKX03_025580 [Papaver bracteatum]|nr:hypothetical protein MKX03_025580 [Papaver bracteatum]